ncbi:FkbM family methyltransferase [Fulvivirga sp. 29W222]|uniref:FkbM family methyltransferase n=1 Tax=Fulvivirga marina TaxID=2494733 RepID=A0A937FWE8_9BACT|nr:FkbM family methyltransferase [Fulvivirga marina]MBL6445748.1 FkbM family methyltransferase [Fulvivirga marina]
MGLKYRSQKGQDKWLVEEIFDYKQKGYFVDLAASDGITINNTYALEKRLGWTGICIEPNEVFYKSLLEYRNCQTANIVIDKQDDVVVDFRSDNMWSGGIVDEDTDNNEHYRSEQLKTATISKRTTKKLETLLDEISAPKIIDYLSLDVEGAETRILRDFAFDKYIFLALTIERPTLELEEALFDNGYVYVTKSKVGNEFDTFYVHNSIPNFSTINKESYRPTPKKDF